MMIKITENFFLINMISCVMNFIIIPVYQKKKKKEIFMSNVFTHFLCAYQ